MTVLQAGQERNHLWCFFIQIVCRTQTWSLPPLGRSEYWITIMTIPSYISHYSTEYRPWREGSRGAMKAMARASQDIRGAPLRRAYLSWHDIVTSIVHWKCTNCPGDPEDRLMGTWLRLGMFHRSSDVGGGLLPTRRRLPGREWQEAGVSTEEC